jgi:hypothetical protein
VQILVDGVVFADAVALGSVQAGIPGGDFQNRSPSSVTT